VEGWLKEEGQGVLSEVEHSHTTNDNRAGREIGVYGRADGEKARCWLMIRCDKVL